MEEIKVAKITKNDITIGEIVKFFLFWGCMILLWFKQPLFSVVLSILMLSTIRVRMIAKGEYELEYGVIPLLRRGKYGKKNNQNQSL